MNPLFRKVLGLTLLAVLVPVIAVALPAGFSEPMSSKADDLSVQANPSSSLASQDQTGESSFALPAPRLVPRDPLAEPSPNTTILSSPSTSSPVESSTTEQATDSSTTTPSAITTSTSTPVRSSTTSAPKTSTTAAPPNSVTTVAIGAGPTDGTISGNACPCTVTGAVELKGNISLKGDLTVDGGTLIARSGVSLDGSGFQIVFMNGGKADFQGTPVFTWSENGSKQNLSRDLNFRNLRRIMFHSGAGKSVLKYFTLSDSGTAAFDDYPLHWHLNGDSTRGTIVEGVVVINGANHAFVPHGSNGITFKDTIAKNTSGDAYWWNGPGTNESCSFQKYCTLDNSNDISYDHALADGVTNGPGDNRGFRLSGFTLGAGSGNAIRNSAAININPSNVKDCAGFQWPESANQNVGGNVWTFENNFSASPSGCHGLFIWQNDSNLHVISGFSGGGIDHGAYTNKYDYRNVTVPYLQIHAVGWTMTDSFAGQTVALGHVIEGTVVFTNVTFDSFTVDDAGGKPATYVLTDTNLVCADIVYESIHPESQVIIDGQEC